MKRILKGSIGVFLLLGFLLLGCDQDKKASSESKAQTYTCPMHPEILQNGPGTCPICKMDLVPLHSTAAHGPADDSLNALVKPTNELVISGIKTVRPEKGSRTAEMSLKGVINYNTNNWKSVSARVSGRIERLYVKYSFEQVRKGQKIMDIYSPDLANAQQELLFLKNNSELILLESAKKKLLFLGFTQSQIDQVLRSGKISPTVSVYSPYSGYVAELALNAAASSGSSAQAGGTRISSSSSAGMNEMNSGGSADVVPTVQSISTGQALQIREGQYVTAGQKLFDLINTEQVWAEFFARPDQLQEFKRGMKVSVRSLDIAEQNSDVQVDLIQPYYREGVNYSLIRANLPNSNRAWKVGQLISVSKQSKADGNWVPRTAVLQLGKKYVVFIRRNSAFVPVYIQVNKLTDEWVDIGNSLGPDQEIAINAWFLVDTESFIKAERL
ncbi:Multidrug efflux pump subunit AcrA (membrane-fusion protein) [Daejeonella rubra]|uniref:Multidrug efflux pump subunit AcrA (Membrane-fusion protein) n=1 Tax=Daejeonella rubra TaxID=990371 RepID=A0A1G9T8H8_9SPHI|nr:efflux RND transporter periplasmic adaptor subunit [Daejeonella rubra]SDM43974.1 Multidrug efflux pump subunit AcrA (membrane-fusion protein) [Daejeonella rubra]